MNNTEIIPFALAGEGYQLTIAAEAEARKSELLTLAGNVTTVSSNDESGDAQHVTRKLAALRIEVEKHRKMVKEPINLIGKLIDATAKGFIADVEAEEKRIAKLVGDHAMEVARIRAAKEAEERRAFEEARAAREAAGAAAATAEGSGRIADIIAAKKAEAERMETLAARMEASAEVATTRIADGVRFAWDFEIEDIHSVYRSAPDLIDLTCRRSAILSWFRELEAADEDVASRAALVGIAAFKKPVVSSR
jgi:hypothetical protein